MLFFCELYIFFYVSFIIIQLCFVYPSRIPKISHKSKPRGFIVFSGDILWGIPFGCVDSDLPEVA